MSGFTDKRDSFVEAWRGIAVLLVVYYHYVDRVPPEVFGNVGRPLMPFYSGPIGVLVFFVISGFLIAKSLRYSTDLSDFYAKRLSRIWPLFIVSCFFVYCFLKLVPPPIVTFGPDRFYADERTTIDLLGSLFFLKDLGIDWVDGVYWSILVELKFYFMIGLMAWVWPTRFGERFAAISAAFGLAELASELFLPESLRIITRMLNGLAVAHYLPFFAVGVLLHLRRTGPLLTLNLLLVVAFFGLKVASNPDFELPGTLHFLLAFGVLIAIDAAIFGQRLFVFLGKYSYSLYLFHQMVGITIIARLSPIVGLNTAALIAFFIVLAISVGASELFEWRFRRTFYMGLNRVFAALRLNRMVIGSGAENQVVATRPGPVSGTDARTA